MVVLPASAFISPGASSSARSAELDWLRGAMLVLMTVTHLPTALSGRLSQPFGFVSAAEGFVFLSAFLVGAVYSRMAIKRGVPQMQAALVGRARKIYAVHVGLLLFLFLGLVPFAQQIGAGAITDLASLFRAHPEEAVAGGLLLTYNPPLLDILPMYALFLLATPLVLAWAMRKGWRSILMVSAVIWLLAQWGAGRAAYGALAAVAGASGSYADTGAFSFLAWQLLWVAGLWAGAGALEAPAGRATPLRAPWWRRPGVVHAAFVIAVVFCAWRHLVGQAPFGSLGYLNAYFDKWTLGPMRIVNFAVLAIIVIHFRETLRSFAADSVLTTLGRAPLTVFCLHLVLCLVLLALVGNAPSTAPTLQDAGMMTLALAILYVAARLVAWGDGLRSSRTAWLVRGGASAASPASRMAR